MLYRITFIILFVLSFNFAFTWTPQEVANLSVEELENAFEKGEITTKDLNSYDIEGESPLHISVMEDKVNLTKVLLDLGADPQMELKIKHGVFVEETSVIHKIIDDIENLNHALKVFLKHKSTNIHQKDKDDETIFTTAAVSYNKFDIANLLIDLGARKPSESEIQKYKEIFKNDSNILLKIEESIMDHDIAFAYHNASKEAKQFTQSNQELPEYDSQGFPFICYATIKGDEILLEQLIKKYNVNAQDKHGNTAIMFACMTKKYNLTTMLLDNGANAGIKNKFESDSLSFSIFNDPLGDNIDFHLKLMEHGANPLSTSVGGKNILHLMLNSDNSANKLKKLLSIKDMDVDQLNDQYQSIVDHFFTGDPENEISNLILNKTKDPLYELVIKKLKGHSMQHFRKDDKTTYIGVATTVGYYSNWAFQTGRKIMEKYKDVQVRIITPNMINDEFIQQFNGLITPGSEDNFPKEKSKFNIDNLDPEKMLPIEKLYQQIIDLANKYYIHLIGTCGGNQHIALYHKEYLKPIDNYTSEYNEQHQGIFIPGSTSHFMILTQSEQKKSYDECYLPTIITDIITNHHYAVNNKLTSLKIGVKSEEGIVQSVYDGFKSIGTQFHPEEEYTSPIFNRQQTFWDNFVMLCKDHNQALSFAKKNNIDSLIVLKQRDNKLEEILDRLEECAQNNPTNETIIENNYEIAPHILPIYDPNKCTDGIFQFSDYYNLHSLLQKNN